MQAMLVKLTEIFLPLPPECGIKGVQHRTEHAEFLVVCRSHCVIWIYES